VNLISKELRIAVMLKMKSFAGLLIFVVASLGPASGVLASDQRYLFIGTGGVTGVYYPTGGSICRMINSHRKVHGIRCGVESTLGSVYNILKIREGDLSMGVVQSDVQYRAWKGSGEFVQIGPDKELRAIFSIHSEPFTLVARKGLGIQRLEDLRGKRVNIGNTGSGQRATMDVLMHELGWSLSVFSQVSELKSLNQSKALCDNRFDAMVFTVGHPSASIKEATTACNSSLVNVGGAAVDKMIAENPYYSAVSIPAGMYRGNDEEVSTFGVSATLVTSSKMPDDVIYILVKAVFDNLNTFKILHPAFQGLQKEQMISEGLSAPLHSGAIRYYKEVGLM